MRSRGLLKLSKQHASILLRGFRGLKKLLTTCPCRQPTRQLDPQTEIPPPVGKRAPLPTHKNLSLT